MVEWSIDDVAERFSEAVETGRRLPPVRVQGHFNSWSLFACQVPDRYPDPERLYRPMPPSPDAVERMLEVMRWLEWLEVEQRHLVWMRAKQYEWQKIARRFGCCTKTAQRRWQRALLIVADHLNRVPTPYLVSNFEQY